MKKILGLDLGTNSIGWAVVKCETDDLSKITGLESAGSRIIPMDAAVLGDFAKGNAVSQTSQRTGYRGIRRLRERCLLRRERLHRVLDVLGFLPQHYSDALNRYGQFANKETEEKLAWIKKDANNYTFLFQDSYKEMLEDFRSNQPEFIAGGGLIPYDWTIFYLRKKALSKPITKEELAWILLNFNKKRGYYQLRGEEEEEDTSKLVEYYALKVESVEDTGEKKGRDTWYNIHLENGMIYRRVASQAPDWVGKIKEFIVTTSLENGVPKKDKEGNIKRSFRMPSSDDWALQKKRSELDIDNSHKEMGAYIYDALLKNPMQKIKGGLVRTIERKYYKKELIKILNTQKQYIAELQDEQLYAACIKELYGSNDAYRNSIAKRDFTYLFVDNIIFYQRPLKSNKSSVSECPYEYTESVDKKTGEILRHPVKCISKAHPLYQEFRLWQFISNLRLYEREKVVGGELKLDVDVTTELINKEEDYVALFNFLNDKENISQNELFISFFKIGKPAKKENKLPYRWNYVEDRSYPCNETRGMMLTKLKKAGVPSIFLTPEVEEQLWHILYSVCDKIEIRKAMTSFANKHHLPDAFVEEFCKIKPFVEYGAYSAKAVKKLLPLMRRGSRWSADAIDSATRQRMEAFMQGNSKELIVERAINNNIPLKQVSDYQGLPTWLACYIVYGRHSEASDISRWRNPDDIDAYLKSFKQHSLRNPIVEQVITETLRVVRDIWKQCGQIDEIHVELGRDMKNPADKRARLTQTVLDNENANLRAKALLTEFMNPQYEVENVRPSSPSQQELFRIYEDGVLSGGIEVPDEIEDLLKKFSQNDVNKRPTSTEIMRYRLWLDQKYRSPYTGKMIPLGKLFTPQYEIEHIIPQSRYFDNSFTNKVICESEVNKLKDNMLGYEFIKQHGGRIVPLNMGGQVTVLSANQYEELVKTDYKHSRIKMKKLLMEDVPDAFIERQMNDSRYISKFVKALLSNIVREEDEQEATSKHLIACNGSITDYLKKDWGVNDVWNQLILPRFRRMNELTHTKNYTAITPNGHEIPEMPIEQQRGFNKKRIDHRHHAMDAIVIACATRSHVNLLNNEAALGKNNLNRIQLSRKLRRYEDVVRTRNGVQETIHAAKEFNKPWPTFTTDVKTTLENIVVSFKQNLRVINKTRNHYLHIENGKKVRVVQTKGDSWAIRKPMHKETVFGEINLQRIKTVSLNEAVKRPQSIVNKELRLKILELQKLHYDAKMLKNYFSNFKREWEHIDFKKIAVYYFTKDTNERFFASRKPLDTSFNKSKIEGAVADSAIRKILLAHLDSNQGKAEIAFSPDGIDAMNRNIQTLNDGVPHQPIYKVRVYEKAEKFAVGQVGNKKKKFVEAAKGTNLFFAVYESDNGRSFASIPLNVIIERQKQGLPSVPNNEEGKAPAFVLSPNDFVYVPTPEEVETGRISEPIDKKRIYKMVSCTGNEIYFINSLVANVIVNKIEYSPLNKMGRAISGEMIKEICLPLHVDRLGNIIH